MNFILVGFVLANLQLDLNLWAGYAIKLVGGLFFLGGIYELGGLDKEADRLRAPGIVFSISCAGAALAAFLLRESTAIRFTGIAAGAVTTALAGLLFRLLFAMFKAKPGLVDNIPEVVRLCPRYDRMLILLAAVLTADCVNRFTSGAAADVSGFIAVYTKIAAYVFLAVCALSVNKLRQSYNSAHPVG